MSELELRLEESEDDSGGDAEDPWVSEPEADDSGGDPEFTQDDSGGDPELMTR